MIHTPGPWIDSPKVSDAVISMHPDEMAGDGTGVKYYGGAVIAETILPRNKPLIKAAPALLAACKLAKQHLDAMRLESGIGNVMLPFEKEAFEQVDQALTTAIAQAEGGEQ